MKIVDNIEIIAQNNLEKAELVIKNSGIRQAWQSSRLNSNGIIDEAPGY